MKLEHLYRFLPCALLAASAAAQAPVYIQLPNNYAPQDCGVAGYETIVVGIEPGGNSAFRWTPTGGVVSIGTVHNGTAVRVSANGATIMADTVGVDGKSRASIWAGGTTWTQLPGLAGASGSIVSIGGGVSGDGTTVVGLAYGLGGDARAFRWTAANGTQDLGTLHPGGFAYRASAVDFDGDTIFGWQRTPSVQRNASIWTGATLPLTQTLLSFGALTVADPYAVSADGTIAVGVFATGSGSNDAWRWDAATGVSVLPQMAGFTTPATALDLTDDGFVVIGYLATACCPFSATSGVWVNGVPDLLDNYLAAIGTSGLPVGGPPGPAQAIRGDGRTIVGSGGGGFGGWIIDTPRPGASFCSNGTLGLDHTTVCPCGNVGLPLRGCGHSFNADGAQLEADGDIPSDTVVLHSRFEPVSSFTLFMQHASPSDSIFHDGVLCAGNPLIRLRGRGAVAGEAFFPNSNFAQDSTTTLSIRGGVTIGSGATRYYAAWFRNASTTYCPPATANVSNGWTLTW